MRACVRCVRAQDCFTNPSARAVVRQVVLDTIDMCTESRRMFASNFPVDKLGGDSLRLVYDTMLDFVSHLPDTDLAALFNDNAAKFYKLVYE